MTNLPQSMISKDKLPVKKLGPSPLWFKALSLFTTFTLGGWVAVELTQRLLQNLADRLVTVEAQAEILNALDHLFPYRLGYVAIALLLSWITVGAYLWLRTKSTLIISLTFAIPLMALCWFWVLRVPLAAPVAATSPTPTPAATRAPTTATSALTGTVAPTPALAPTATEAPTLRNSLLTKVPLKPADSDAPASGICASSDGDIVEATLTADGPPMPRCVKVTAAQRLKIINGTTAPVRIMLGHFDVEIPAGRQAVLDKPVGEYLAPGVHLMVNGPEVWLSQP